MNKTLSYILTLTTILSCHSAPLIAGTPFGVLKKLGALIDTLSIKGVDRQYIDNTELPWQVILKGNINQSDLKMDVTELLDPGVLSFKPRLRTEPSTFVGIWAGYRGYGLGYTVNVGGDEGSYLTFGATGGSYGLNVRIHRFENKSPEFTFSSSIDGEDFKVKDQIEIGSPIKMRTLIANGYYLFNGRHFSYAAAYDQSVIQKRSAGSLMAGAMYYHAHINYANNRNANLIYIMKNIGRVKLWQASIGIGYAYNWVPVNGLLVNAMAMPMLTFVNDIKVFNYTTNIEELINKESGDNDPGGSLDKMRIEKGTDKTQHGSLNVNFDARLSLTYNFGRYFVNAYGQFNRFRYHYHDNKGRLNDWYINASLGIRL